MNVWTGFDDLFSGFKIKQNNRNEKRAGKVDFRGSECCMPCVKDGWIDGRQKWSNLKIF